jgi:hypothetical protein
MGLSAALIIGIAAGATFAEKPAAPSHDAVKGAVAQWIDGLRDQAYTATFRASDGKSPLPSKRINDRLFAFQEGDVYIGIGFKKAPANTSTLQELRQTFAHLALDRIPVPGIDAKHWETRLRTPRSSFREGVTIESWEAGVIKLRVRTEFFAAGGRRTDILVPADAGMPEGTYFQIRRPIRADFLIEGRLF